jgi:hypothetical protein
MDEPNEKRCRELVKERALKPHEEFMASWFDVMKPQCEMCGRAPLAEMHHRQNRSQGGLWVPSNILGLCIYCHRYVTEHPEAAREWGVGSLRRLQVPAEVPVQLWHSESRLLLDDEGGYRAAA